MAAGSLASVAVMNHQFPHLLAAGWNELISVLVGLLFLVFWVLGQIADVKKKRAQPPRPPAVPPVPGGPQAAPRAQPAPVQPVRAQVDEFLRRALQQGQPQGARPAPPPRPPVRRDEIEVLVDDEPARTPLAEPLRPMGGAAAAPPPIQPPRRHPLRRVALGRPQSVAEHVAAHVGSAVEQIREEVSHLGESVITADEQFDVQLQHKFDHKLGALSARHTSRVEDQQAAVKADTPASQIAAMLASPEGVRQAIVVNEILRRPEERW